MSVRLADEWYSFLPAGTIVSIRDDLGLSYAQAGAVLVSLSAGGLAGHVFTVAADYLDRRLIATLGAFACGGSMVMFAVAGSFWMILLAGLVWGASTDAFVHGCEVALVDMYRDDLAPVLSRVNALGAVGDLAGPLMLIAFAAADINWRIAFAGGGGMMICYGGYLSLQPFPPPRPPEHAATPLSGIASVLRDRRIIVLALVAGLFGLLDEPFFGFVLAFLQEERGLPQSAATAVVAFAVGGGILGFLLVPHLSARHTAGRLLWVFGTFVTVAVSLIIFAPSVPLQAGAGFVFGVCGALFWNTLESSYLALRPGQAGTTGAVVSTIGLAGVGYPILVGRVSDAAGLTTGLALYAAVPAVMMLLLAVAGRGHVGEAA